MSQKKSKEKSTLDKLADYLPDFLGGTAVEAKRRRKKALKEAQELRTRAQREVDK